MSKRLKALLFLISCLLMASCMVLAAASIDTYSPSGEITLSPSGDDTSSPATDNTTAPDSTQTPDTPQEKKPVEFLVPPPDNIATEYYEGDTFSTAGIHGVLKYSDGSSAFVNTVSATVSVLTPDTTKIQFYCPVAPSLKSVYELPVTVHAIKDITVNATNNSLTSTYYEGDVFGNDQLKSLIITVNYDNGFKRVVDYESCNIFGANVPLSLDTPNIVITYGTKSCTLTLNVKEVPVLTGLQILLTPEFNNSYVEGQTFNPAGLTIIANYSAGKNPEIVASDSFGFSKVSFSPSLDTALSTSNTKVTITYTDGANTFSVDQSIVVTQKSAIGMSVFKNPDKMVYTEGECFDFTGMLVSISYNDGSSINVNSGFTVSHTNTPFVLTSNSTEMVNIEITYLDQSCTLPVSVNPAEVASITLLSPPAKLNYAIGEFFDPTGIVLLVTYVDPTLAPVSISENSFTCVPTSALTADDDQIYIYFRGQTLKVSITVSETGTPPDSDNTTSPTPPITTTPPPTTTTPPESSDVTTTPPPATSDPETTPGTTPSTPDPTDTTVSPEDTTDGGSDDDGGNTTLIVLWVIILAVIVIALVVLIIYYKRNFT